MHILAYSINIKTKVVPILKSPLGNLHFQNVQESQIIEILFNKNVTNYAVSLKNTYTYTLHIHTFTAFVLEYARLTNNSIKLCSS